MLPAPPGRFWRGEGVGIVPTGHYIHLRWNHTDEANTTAPVTHWRVAACILSDTPGPMPSAETLPEPYPEPAPGQSLNLTEAATEAAPRDCPGGAEHFQVERAVEGRSLHRHGYFLHAILGRPIVPSMHVLVAGRACNAYGCSDFGEAATLSAPASTPEAPVLVVRKGRCLSEAYAIGVALRGLSISPLSGVIVRLRVGPSFLPMESRVGLQPSGALVIGSNPIEHTYSALAERLDLLLYNRDPERDYILDACALNERGRGAWSHEISILSQAARVPRLPILRDVAAAGGLKSDLRLSWRPQTAPSSVAAIVSGLAASTYHIELRDQSCSGKRATIGALRDCSRSFDIPASPCIDLCSTFGCTETCTTVLPDVLVAGANYTVRLWGSNECGIGAFSRFVHVHAPLQPPRAVVAASVAARTETSIRLDWTVHEFDQQVLGFEVRACEAMVPDNCTAVTVDGTARSTTISALESAKVYAISVSVVGEHGEAPHAEAAVTNTLGVPRKCEAPTDVSSTFANVPGANSTIALLWEPPFDNGLQIERFELEHTQYASTSQLRGRSAAEAEPTHTELIPVATAYPITRVFLSSFKENSLTQRVRIRATNAAGVGEWSEPMFVQRPGGALPASTRDSEDGTLGDTGLLDVDSQGRGGNEGLDGTMFASSGEAGLSAAGKSGGGQLGMGAVAAGGVGSCLVSLGILYCYRRRSRRRSRQRGGATLSQGTAQSDEGRGGAPHDRKDLAGGSGAGNLAGDAKHVAGAGNAGGKKEKHAGGSGGAGQASCKSHAEDGSAAVHGTALGTGSAHLAVQKSTEPIDEKEQVAKLFELEAFVSGLDDHPNLVVNPLMLQKQELHKARERRDKMAREGESAGVDASGGTSKATSHRAGAFGRLRLQVQARGEDGSLKMQQLKKLEAFLQRHEAVQVTLNREANIDTHAGSGATSTLQVAQTSSTLRRRERASFVADAARKARQAVERSPQAAGLRSGVCRDRDGGRRRDDVEAAPFVAISSHVESRRLYRTVYLRCQSGSHLRPSLSHVMLHLHLTVLSTVAASS